MILTVLALTGTANAAVDCMKIEDRAVRLARLEGQARRTSDAKIEGDVADVALEVEGLSERVVALESKKPAPLGRSPAGEAVVADMNDPGAAPSQGSAVQHFTTGLELVATTVRPSGNPNGFAFNNLGDVVGLDAMACVQHGDWVSVSGPGTATVYADMDGDGYAESVPYDCARASARVYVLGVGAEEPVGMYFVKRSDTIVEIGRESFPVYTVKARREYYGFRSGGLHDITGKAGVAKRF